MLLKTISLFRQGPVQVTCLTGHKRFHNRAFILAIMISHLLLSELRHSGWDFSRQGSFMKLSLARPSSEERCITITVSTNESFTYNNYECH